MTLARVVDCILLEFSEERGSARHARNQEGWKVSRALGLVGDMTDKGAGQVGAHYNVREALLYSLARAIPVARRATRTVCPVQDDSRMQ